MPPNAPLCPGMPQLSRFGKTNPNPKRGRSRVQECSTMFRNVQQCSAPAKSAKRTHRKLRAKTNPNEPNAKPFWPLAIAVFDLFAARAGDETNPLRPAFV